MKQTQAGRQTKRPAHSLDDSGSGAFIGDALAILGKCGAPKSWGYKDAWLIYAATVAPQAMDALRHDPKSGKLVVNELTTDGGMSLSTEVMLALWFAHRFAEAPHVIIKALLMMRKVFVKRMKSPEFIAAVYSATHPESWDLKAHLVAKSISTCDCPVTANVFEKGRKKARQFPPFMG